MLETWPSTTGEEVQWHGPPRLLPLLGLVRGPQRTREGVNFLSGIDAVLIKTTCNCSSLGFQKNQSAVFVSVSSEVSSIQVLLLQ